MNATLATSRKLSNKKIPIIDWNTYRYGVEISMEKHLSIPKNGMEHLEEETRKQTLTVQREILENAVQKKADITPPICPK